MTEKERNCLLRIAGELVELCRTSEKTKVSKADSPLEETYIDPLGPMADPKELERRAREAAKEILGDFTDDVEQEALT